MVTAAARTPPTPDSLPIPPLPGAVVVPLVKVLVDPKLNPRTEVDPDTLDRIEASMRAHLAAGRFPQETPIWAIPAGPDQWQLRAGWTRHAAIMRILAKPPADLPPSGAVWIKSPTLWISPHNVDALGAEKLSLRENLMRSALSMPDVVNRCHRIRKEHPAESIAALARDIGMSDRLLGNMLRTRDTLTEEQWQAYVRRGITQEQAIRLAGIHDADARQKAFLELLEDRKPAEPKAKPQGGANKDDEDGDEEDDEDDDDDDNSIKITRVAAIGIAKRANELVTIARKTNGPSPAYRLLEAVVNFVMHPNPQLHESSRRTILELVRPAAVTPATPPKSPGGQKVAARLAKAKAAPKAPAKPKPKAAPMKGAAPKAKTRGKA